MRMKNYYYMSSIALLLVCLASPLEGRGDFNQNTSIKKEWEVDLQKKAEQLKIAYNDKDSLLFFKLFPDTFNSFMGLYGYGYNEESGITNYKLGSNPLYEEAYDHIAFIFKCKDRISCQIFYEKMFNITKNGKWDADTPSYLQRGLKNMILQDTHHFVKFLSKKDIKDINGFWFFMIDGLVLNNMVEHMQELYNVINPIDKEQGDLLKKQFDKKSNDLLKWGTDLLKRAVFI